MLKSCAALSVMGMLAGCESKGFIAPDEMVRGGTPKEPLVIPILSQLDPVSEAGPGEYASAQPPRPSDLVASSNDYTVGRNDLLNISISDLQGPGQETVKVVRVSESGNISLPYLGSLHAEGLTEIELEAAIMQAYKDANLIQNAQVSVTVAEARGRSVEILGAVQAPGQYAILDSDFRLLNALVLAKDTTSPLTEYIYVIRRESGAKSTTPSTRPVIQPNPTGSPAKPAGPTPDELSPKSEAAPATPNDVAAADRHEAARPLSLLADAPAGKEGAAMPAAAAVAAAPAAPSGHFEFNAPDSSATVRVIRIPYQAIRSGDLNYNISIHPRDVIVVQQLPVGEYYMGGHVARPGAFTLTGRRITIKEAVISAGMFDDLAIPQRTDIIRRLKPGDREVFVRVDLERIFAGEQPDIYLKPDDQIMVGTNALSPFLSAVRGAFRITYGFGFLYDRNYAYNSNTLGF